MVQVALALHYMKPYEREGNRISGVAGSQKQKLIRVSLGTECAVALNLDHSEFRSNVHIMDIFLVLTCHSASFS